MKPDPDKYFFERPSSGKRLPKLPALADSKFLSIEKKYFIVKLEYQEGQVNVNAFSCN